jgi:lipid-binding SYLF domain-containing protein
MKERQSTSPRVTRSLFSWVLSLIFLAAFLSPHVSAAATQAEINRDVNIALDSLYKTTPAAKKLAGIAKGILVFPSIIQGGLIVGGHYGEGALRIKGKTKGFYNTVSASYGLQIGAQSFGYALFFLDEKSLEYLKKSDGWEFGTSPGFVLVDQGIAKTISTTTANSGIYAFFFNQKGLMADISIEGSKITPIHPQP